MKPSHGLKVALIFLLWGGRLAHGQTNWDQVFYERAQKACDDAGRLNRANPDNATNAWGYGSTCYDLAAQATNETQRAAVARWGIDACRHLLALNPQSAPGHYYLAMNLGELAEAEAPSLAAYKLVHEVEREFTEAAALDAKLDYAGPARCLGLLYRDAPGWPLSIGSKKKAQDWLNRAGRLAPGYPENALNLVETHLRWREREEAAAAWQKLEQLWPVAQTNLTGVTWEQPWHDWTKRREAARNEYQKLYKKTP